jgi:hypothetical protein
MHSIRATARCTRAIHATAELLEKLRVEAMFVGDVARAAWLRVEAGGGAVDVLALMNAQQKNQLAMMASHRGFRVDREELERAEELDLVPLTFIDAQGDVRVHVLLASNALYGRMFAGRVDVSLDERTIRVPRAEDLALMVSLGDDRVTLQRLMALPDFDRGGFQERLISIGVSPR